MAEAQDATDGAVKRMRRTARILALIWGGLWTCLVAAAAWFVVASCSRVWALDVVARPIGQCIGEVWPVLPVVLVLWAPAAIARRREAIAGILLAAEGLVGFALVAWGAFWALQEMLRWGVGCGLMPLFLCLLALALPVPPSVAATLLLASWWKSRTLAAPQATE
jgi:hypothetical protein